MLKTQYYLLLCLCSLVIAAIFTSVLKPSCSGKYSLHTRKDSDLGKEFDSCADCALFTHRVTNPGKTLTLVLTYLRSGSTLTGDILQQSPKSFYLYEPLKSYNSNIFLDGQICNIFTMNCSTHNSDEILTVIADLFRCRLQEHKPLIRHSHKQSVVMMNVIPYCKLKPESDTCVKNLQTVCYQSQSIIFKTIRLSMDLMPSLLTKFPGLKVVHLLRDPRGIIDSRRRGGFLRNSGIAQSSKSLCALIRKNVQYSKTLQSRFPNRILTVLYEDIAQNPVGLSNKFYSELHLKYSDNFEEWIFNHTSAGIPDNAYYETVRSNSSETSQSWRKRLSFKDVKVIEEECGDIIDLLGFRKVIDVKDQKNTDQTLKVRSIDL